MKLSMRMKVNLSVVVAFVFIIALIIHEDHAGVVLKNFKSRTALLAEIKNDSEEAKAMINSSISTDTIEKSEFNIKEPKKVAKKSHNKGKNADVKHHIHHSNVIKHEKSGKEKRSNIKERISASDVTLNHTHTDSGSLRNASDSTLTNASSVPQETSSILKLSQSKSSEVLLTRDSEKVDDLSNVELVTPKVLNKSLDNTGDLFVHGKKNLTVPVMLKKESEHQHLHKNSQRSLGFEAEFVPDTHPEPSLNKSNSKAPISTSFGLKENETSTIELSDKSEIAKTSQQNSTLEQNNETDVDKAFKFEVKKKSLNSNQTAKHSNDSVAESIKEIKQIDQLISVILNESDVMGILNELEKSETVSNANQNETVSSLLEVFNTNQNLTQLSFQNGKEEIKESEQIKSKPETESEQIKSKLGTELEQMKSKPEVESVLKDNLENHQAFSSPFNKSTGLMNISNITSSNKTQNRTEMGLESIVSAGLDFLVNSEVAKNAALAMEIFNLSDTSITDHVVDDPDMHSMIDMVLPSLSAQDDQNLTSKDQNSAPVNVTAMDNSQNTNLAEKENKNSTSMKNHTLNESSITSVKDSLNVSVSDKLIEPKEEITSTVSSNNTAKTKCPSPGICVFWFMARDACTSDGQCLGSKICCRVRCSKQCIDVKI